MPCNTFSSGSRGKRYSAVYKHCKGCTATNPNDYSIRCATAAQWWQSCHTTRHQCTHVWVRWILYLKHFPSQSKQLGNDAWALQHFFALASWASIFLYIYIYIFLCIYKYIFKYIYICIQTFACIYIYIYYIILYYVIKLNLFFCLHTHTLTKHTSQGIPPKKGFGSRGLNHAYRFDFYQPYPMERWSSPVCLKIEKHQTQCLGIVSHIRIPIWW